MGAAHGIWREKMPAGPGRAARMDDDPGPPAADHAPCPAPSGPGGMMRIPFPWVSPTAIKIFPLRGTRNQKPKKGPDYGLRTPDCFFLDKAATDYILDVV